MNTVLDPEFACMVISLISNGKVDEALDALSKFYGVTKPRLRIGRVKGKVRSPAVYIARNKTIVVQDASHLNNPLVILHEFYHHLRYVGGVHRGTETKADEYAKSFIYTCISNKGK